MNLDRVTWAELKDYNTLEIQAALSAYGAYVTSSQTKPTFFTYFVEEYLPTYDKQSFYHRNIGKVVKEWKPKPKPVKPDYSKEVGL